LSKVNPEYAQFRPYLKNISLFCIYFYPSRIKAVIHHLLAKDTIDHRVMMALDNKDTGQNALIEAVKARIENLRNGG